MTPTAILESVTPEAIQQKAEDIKRYVTARARDVEDLKDNAVHTVKRSPLTSLALAFGAGMLVTAAFSWLACGPSSKATR